MKIAQWLYSYGFFKRSVGINLIVGIWLSAAVSLVGAFWLTSRAVESEGLAKASAAKLSAFQQIQMTAVKVPDAHYQTLAAMLSTRYIGVQATATKEGLKIAVKDAKDYDVFMSALTYVASQGGTTRFEAKSICAGECKGDAYSALIEGRLWQ